jgi:hypothetical protein
MRAPIYNIIWTTFIEHLLDPCSNVSGSGGVQPHSQLVYVLLPRFVELRLEFLKIKKKTSA